MKQAKKENEYFKNFINICSLISLLICLIFNKVKGYNLLFLMPLTHLIVYNSFIYIVTRKKLNLWKPGLIMKMVFIVSTLKYSIMPISMIVQEYLLLWGNAYGKWGPTPHDNMLLLGIVLCCLEEFVIYIVYLIYIFNKSNVRNDNIVKLGNKWILVTFCIFAFIYIIIFSPSTLSLKSFFNSSLQTSSSSNQLTHEGIITILRNILSIGILVLSLDFAKTKIKNSWGQILTTYLILLFVLSINMGMSRWQILFLFITGTYFIYLYFGKKSFIPAIILAIIVSIAAITITRIKFSYQLKLNASLFDVVSMLFCQMPDYFSGPRLVAQGIDMASKFQSQIGLSTIYNDLLGNMPIISSFIDQVNRINSYFCNYNFGVWSNNTLLIPMVAEGYNYLPIFPFVLTIFYSYLQIKFDSMQQKERSLDMKFLYTLEGLWLSFAFCLNSQTNWGHFIELFVMSYLVLKVNKKIKIKP